MESTYYSREEHSNSITLQTTSDVESLGLLQDVHRWIPPTIHVVLKNENYPTITALLKRTDGALKRICYPSFTRKKFFKECSVFFNDPEIEIRAPELDRWMDHPSPRFVYFYSRNVETNGYRDNQIEKPGIDVCRMNAQITRYLCHSKKLLRQGNAVAVEKMYKPFAWTPCFYDVSSGKTFALRSAISYLEMLQSESNHDL